MTALWLVTRIEREALVPANLSGPPMEPSHSEANPLGTLIHHILGSNEPPIVLNTVDKRGR